MSLLRSARFPAIVLLCAAALGLIVANSAWGPALAELKHTYIGIPGVFELSVEHWIADGLLAIFFFVVAVELQFELTSGELNSARKAVQPAIAATGGVLVPIAIYLVFTWATPESSGWPIPTATDIAFALGILAIVGRSLPAGFRALLLALAVIDDLIAILIIAVFFTTDLQFLPLLLAVPVILAFGWLSRRARGWAIPALVVLGVLASALV
ncbi:MAG: Na+/H+ antiporter NhaA, partial [Microbacterium sp.]